MAFQHWSTSASGNASPAGINFAEGQLPSTLNNSIREMMAQLRTKYAANEWSWVAHSATASVNSQTVFKLAGDQTAIATAGRRCRLTGGSTTGYSTVVSSSYTAETTVTILKDSGSLSASMSIAAFGIHGRVGPLEEYVVACSDETTALTTGTGKATFRIRGPFTVTEVRAWLTTAQTSGSIFTVDINEAGVSILSTKITIDNGEKTSTTAVTPAVLSDKAIADDAEMTVDIDQVGDGTAKGLKISVIGFRG